MSSLQIGIQWNLSIADMLYSGHLSIADSIFGNQLPIIHWNLPLYSGHLSEADTFSGNQWCPLLRGFTVKVLKCQLIKTYWPFVSFKIKLQKSLKKEDFDPNAEEGKLLFSEKVYQNMFSNMRMCLQFQIQVASIILWL